MATAKRFEELECWISARQLVKLVYSLTKHVEVSKDFGFRNQICRAAVSVMSNIAEGFESRTQSLFIDYLGRAKASAGEVRAQLYIAVDLDYISQDQFANAVKLAESSSKQIYGLMQYLESLPNSFRIREGGSSYLT